MANGKLLVPQINRLKRIRILFNTLKHIVPDLAVDPCPMLMKPYFHPSQIRHFIENNLGNYPIEIPFIVFYNIRNISKTNKP